MPCPKVEQDRFANLPCRASTGLGGSNNSLGSSWGSSKLGRTFALVDGDDDEVLRGVESTLGGLGLGGGLGGLGGGLSGGLGNSLSGGLSSLGGSDADPILSMFKSSTDESVDIESIAMGVSNGGVGQGNSSFGESSMLGRFGSK